MRSMDFSIHKYPDTFISNRLEAGKDWDEYVSMLLDPGVKTAAVLVPLENVDDNWHLLFTRRTETVKNHKGQVSFPGGQADRGDSDPTLTALREAYEEVGILPEDIHILGCMNGFVTISRFLVVPVVGIVKWPVDLSLSELEVHSVFTIPLGWFGAKKHLSVEEYSEEGRSYQKVLFYKEYRSESVWGVTAQIVYHLIGILAN